MDSSDYGDWVSTSVWVVWSHVKVKTSFLGKRDAAVSLHAPAWWNELAWRLLRYRILSDLQREPPGEALL